MQSDRDATALADEALRYLAAVELSRALGRHVRWRSEAVELGLDRAWTHVGGRCMRCAGPLARINGQHICFGP